MKINRLLTNVCSNNLAESKSFYTSLFDFNVEFDSDWFVNLKSADQHFEIGIIAKNHDIVPSDAKGIAAGVYLTFVVEDTDALHMKAQELQYEIVQEPEMTFYGQKRMLLKAPEGTICDVSSLA